MGRFDRDNKFDRPRGGRDFKGGRDGGRPSMHEATCSDCGKTCEVPFRPTGDRPVYCTNCFENHGNDGFRSERSGRPERSDRRSFDRPGRDDKKMYIVTCDSCGKKCEVPFRPTGDKPVYCSDCFKKEGGDKGRGSNGPSRDEFAAINAKLDQILKALNPKPAYVKPEVAAPKEEIKAKKAEPVIAKKEKAEKAKAKPAAKKAPAKKKK